MIDAELHAMVWEGLSEWEEEIWQGMDKRLRELGHVNSDLSVVKKGNAGRTTL